MLRDMIGAKTRLIARFGDFQSVTVLLAKAPARVIQMIEDAKTKGLLANAVHLAFLICSLLVVPLVERGSRLKDAVMCRGGLLKLGGLARAPILG
jgi:hypothetical protein